MKVSNIALVMGGIGAIVWVSFQGLPAHTLPPQGWGIASPSVTQENISQTICNPNWSTKSIRPPVSYTNKIKQYYLNDPKWGYADKNMGDYELDHVISLELGGSPIDVKNLWPESYKDTSDGIDYGAHAKDKTENWLHKQVCSGAITLKEAQREISDNWVDVYEQIRTETIPESDTDN